jgi:hypothetical protein
MPPKREYKTITVTQGWGSGVDSNIAHVTAREGRSGWKVESIMHADPKKAHVQFVREV